MASVVVDTHTIVWYLGGDSRLSRNATQALDNATTNGEPIYIPAICLVELTYLVEKGRLPAAARQRIMQAIDDPTTPCRLVPLDRIVVDALEHVDRALIPDLPDRVVAATAVALQTPLATRDGRVRASGIPTIW